MAATRISRRTFVTMATAAVASLGLVACGGNGGSGQNTKDALFNVEVTNTWTCGNYDGSKLLVIDYNLTNNDSNSMPASVVASMYTKAKQGERDLSAAYPSPEIPGVLSNGGDTVSAGQTGKGQAAFELVSEDPVDITITADTKDYKSQVEVYKQTIDLSKVQNVESEASFDLKIDKAFVTDDGQGKNLVVLEMTFTNNADKPASLSSSANLELYQNGTQLKTGYLPYNHPQANQDMSTNLSTNVNKGVSTQVQEAWELLDTTSPVEFKAIDYASFDQRAVVDKTIDVATGQSSDATGGAATTAAATTGASA